MPNNDKTGPKGIGPMTGRRMGQCSSGNVIGDTQHHGKGMATRRRMKQSTGNGSTPVRSGGRGMGRASQGKGFGNGGGRGMGQCHSGRNGMGRLQ